MNTTEEKHICPQTKDGFYCNCQECDTDVSEYGNVDCKGCKKSCNPEFQEDVGEY